MTGEGLAASIDFLERHPDYSFSQGYAYTYQLFGRRLVVWPMSYDYHDVLADSSMSAEGPLSTVYMVSCGLRSCATGWSFSQSKISVRLLKARRAFSIVLNRLRRCAASSNDVRAVRLARILATYDSRGNEYQTITSRNVADFYRNLETFLMGATSRKKREHGSASFLPKTMRGISSMTCHHM